MQNLLGEHLGDGVLNGYSTDPLYPHLGAEYMNVFPLWDWHVRVLSHSSTSLTLLSSMDVVHQRHLSRV